MEELIVKLKKEIIEVLNLEDKSIDDIDTNAPLFLEGLGLDSIDALELTVLLDKKYGIRIQTPEEGKTILYSVQTIADTIKKTQGNN